MAKVFDAAVPPPRALPGIDAVAGYIGRPGFTPHVWTLDEWLRFQHLPQFPFWVPNLRNNPAAEATEAVSAAMALGWAPHQKSVRVIVFDLETATGPVLRSWWAMLAGETSAQGFCAVAYGSLSTVLDVAAADVWAAAWDGIPAMQPGQTIHGTQYKAGALFAGVSVDLSLVDRWLLERAGVGPRHLGR